MHPGLVTDFEKVWFWLEKMDETATMIEDTFHRLQDRPGVSAVVVMNREGQQIKSSMSSGQLADRYSMIIAKLVNAIGASLNALEEKPIVCHTIQCSHV